MDALSKYLEKGNKSGITDKSEQDIRKITVSIATNIGKIRSHNEDNYFSDTVGVRAEENETRIYELDLDERRIFAVCDGMGGEDFGEEASEISAKTLANFADKIKLSDTETLNETVNLYANTANQEIRNMVRKRNGFQSGSTLALVCIDNMYVNIFNIGDSRVYYFRGSQLQQITEDQTLAAKKLKANIYTDEEAKISPDIHTLTSFLGVDSIGTGLKALTYNPIRTTGNMSLLICSDGLTDMCSDLEIQEVLSQTNENPAEKLLTKALDNGGEDNITCIVIQV